MKKEKEQQLRVKIYSVMGRFKGRVRYHADVPASIASQALAYLLPHGKKVPQSKL